MGFDKRKLYSCIRCKALKEDGNASKWHEQEIFYPVQAIDGTDMADIQQGSILAIDMDGMGGAARNEIIRVEVMDPQLVLCKPGIALVFF